MQTQKLGMTQFLKTQTYTLRVNVALQEFKSLQLFIAIDGILFYLSAVTSSWQ